MKKIIAFITALTVCLCTLPSVFIYAASGTVFEQSLTGTTKGAMLKTSNYYKNAEWRKGGLWASSASSEDYLKMLSDDFKDGFTFVNCLVDFPSGNLQTSNYLCRFMDGAFDGTETVTLSWKVKGYAKAEATNDVTVALVNSGTETQAPDVANRRMLYRRDLSGGAAKDLFFGSQNQGAGDYTVDAGSLIPDGDWYEISYQFAPGTAGYHSAALTVKKSDGTVIKTAQTPDYVSDAVFKKWDTLRLTSSNDKSIPDPYSILSVKDFRITMSKPDIKPNAVFRPADTSKLVNLNTVFHVAFDQPIQPATAGNVTLAGHTAEVTMDADAKGFSFRFDALEPYTEYTASISGIIPADGETAFSYDYHFMTGDAVSVSAPYLLDEPAPVYSEALAGFDKTKVEVMGDSSSSMQPILEKDVWGINYQSRLANIGGDTTALSLVCGAGGTTMGRRYLKNTEGSQENAVTFRLSVDVKWNSKYRADGGFFALGIANSKNATGDRVYLYKRTPAAAGVKDEFYGATGTGNPFAAASAQPIAEDVWRTLAFTFTPCEGSNKYNGVVQVKDENGAVLDTISCPDEYTNLTQTSLKGRDSFWINFTPGKTDGTEMLKLRNVKITIDDGSAVKTTVLQNGGNKIYVDYNNGQPDGPWDAVMLAAVCNGTPEDYQLELVKFVEKDPELDQGQFCVELDIPETEGRFVKTYVLENLTTLLPRCGVGYLGIEMGGGAIEEGGGTGGSGGDAALPDSFPG